MGRLRTYVFTKDCNPIVMVLLCVQCGNYRP